MSRKRPPVARAPREPENQARALFVGLDTDPRQLPLPLAPVDPRRVEVLARELRDFERLLRERDLDALNHPDRRSEDKRARRGRWRLP